MQPEGSKPLPPALEVVSAAFGRTLGELISLFGGTRVDVLESLRYARRTALETMATLAEAQSASRREDDG